MFETALDSYSSFISDQSIKLDLFKHGKHVVRAMTNHYSCAELQATRDGDIKALSGGTRLRVGTN